MMTSANHRFVKHAVFSALPSTTNGNLTGTGKTSLVAYTLPRVSVPVQVTAAPQQTGLGWVNSVISAYIGQWGTQNPFLPGETRGAAAVVAGARLAQYLNYAVAHNLATAAQVRAALISRGIPVANPPPGTIRGAAMAAPGAAARGSVSNVPNAPGGSSAPSGGSAPSRGGGGGGGGGGSTQTR